ncbi:ubiquitin-like protein-specific protease ESD4 isoform X1 [Cinnamomum micranthum f. kanehirae]|uniref:Ubiquitin-like protein-specific protease ESD4 isoform X1 n=1 Tax=Cinnamomum micranthum f. kanehirae TaxID=337451 RepID=A0A3S4PVA7_9MAGN|nr:ubiquitin-like protein-specific protease ESD4 isoform X1 [Cinnamomum micranthum f. kanehirae]
MGALSENGKPFEDAFRLNCVLPSRCSSDPRRILDRPSSKKCTTTSMQSAPDRALSSQTPETLTSRIRKFPPASPFLRVVHAPQRNLKFFGSSVRKPQEVKPVLECGKMGNFVSTGEYSARVKKAKAEAFGSLRWLGKVERASNAGKEPSKDGNQHLEDLSLVEDNRLIDGALSDRLTSEVCLPEPSTPTSQSPPSSSIVSIDAGKMMETSMVNHVDIKVRRPPLYKELYKTSERRNSKSSILDFEIRLAQKKISALKLIRQEEEAVPHEPFILLTREEEDYVSHALCGSNRRELLVTHEGSNIEITREVLQCLKPRAWLNDEVINVYLELLKERERRDPKGFLKCHFFNTFFYKKLIGGRNGYDYKAVRRWTTQKKIGYGLIECDKIFVPIHKKAHWCLAVINIKDEKFQYLDSLKGMDTQVLKVLARYFVDEVKDKSDKDIHVSSWKQEFVNDLPVQKNGWDCGMFMIKYADFYSRGSKLCFSQEHMPYFRKRTVKEILRLRAE